MNYQFNEVYEPVVVAECEQCREDVAEGGEGVVYEGMTFCSTTCFINALKQANVLEDI